MKLSHSYSVGKYVGGISVLLEFGFNAVENIDRYGKRKRNETIKPVIESASPLERDCNLYLDLGFTSYPILANLRV